MAFSSCWIIPLSLCPIKLLKAGINCSFFNNHVTSRVQICTTHCLSSAHCGQISSQLCLLLCKYKHLRLQQRHLSDQIISHRLIICVSSVGRRIIENILTPFALNDYRLVALTSEWRTEWKRVCSDQGPSGGCVIISFSLPCTVATSSITLI